MIVWSGMAERLAFFLCERGHGFFSRRAPLNGVVRIPLYDKLKGVSLETYKPVQDVNNNSINHSIIVSMC